MNRCLGGRGCSSCVEGCRQYFSSKAGTPEPPSTEVQKIRPGVFSNLWLTGMVTLPLDENDTGLNLSTRKDDRKRWPLTQGR